MSKRKPQTTAGDEIKIVATNAKARHKFEILERYEAGIELQGSEVKSLRDGHSSISESYAKVSNGQIFVHNLNIDRYTNATHTKPQPLRVRRLLLHRAQIRAIAIQLERKGLALVPLSLYFKRGRAKLELALARGRKAPDKREALRKADAEREIKRAVGRRG